MMKSEAETHVGSRVVKRLPLQNVARKRSRLMQALTLGGCAFLLSACEAPLNLSGVEQELDKSVRRTDQIQSLAATEKVQVAVGSNGLVLTRPNAESPWQRQVLEGEPNLIDVEACPDGSLIALSFERQLWMADVNAQQWRRSDIPTPENMLDAECALDGSYWAVGSFSTLMVSRDGGQNWSENSLNEDAMLSSIQFLDRSTGYVTGEFGVVARTDDGGQSWETLDYIPDDFYPQAAHFSSRETGWVVGLDGMILHTRDGGQSWEAESTPVVAPLYGIAQTDSGLFAMGENGTLLIRSDEQWQRLGAPAMPVWLRSAIEQSNGELLVAGGAGTLLSLSVQK
ncbi:WD40/YVTN/BNR-like repeat-containing protein [Marinobacterium sediminicola]|nr:YCF48-related protein [Marinobacterium sediminicola]ULG68340.1 YCF48-related protein [Marinobacterium sediminicola]